MLLLCICFDLGALAMCELGHLYDCDGGMETSAVAAHVMLG